MAVTKIQTLAQVLGEPICNCRINQDNPLIAECSDKAFYIFSERYELYKACRHWVENNAWRLPLEFVLKHTVDIHHGFNGIHNRMLINQLENLRLSLKEDFNELVFAIIQNKTQFIKNTINEFGYKYIWQPIDDIELEINGFKIFRIK